MKPTVVVGLLGPKLDRASARRDRWSVWRPSVAICQQDDMLVRRFELLYEDKYASLFETVRKDIESTSPETTVCGHQVEMRDPWDFEDVFATLYGFARNYQFKSDEEDYLVHITTGTHVAQICLFLLTESRHLPGKLLQSSPPGRSQNRAGSYRTIDLDLSRYDAIAARFAQEKTEGLSVLKSGIETRDPAFNHLMEQIERVSLATTAPILISGPTGAGKTQLAKRIFQLKRSRELVSGDLVEVNCATIRGEQSMSTLFGHVKGAFTGAVAKRAGLLKTADRGVLFLDEIGELGLDEQAMLLRAIEEKTFLPVGSDQASASDFQLIAGTNRNLGVEVTAGRFREDLLARINLWTFELPSLASRRADIEPNLDFELRQFAETTGQQVAMGNAAKKKFLAFAKSPAAIWRGNFRDLNAAVTRMGTLARNGRVTVEQVDEEISRLQAAWSLDGPAENQAGSTESLLAEHLTSDQVAKIDVFDRGQLSQVIQVCRASKSLSDAGRRLFQASRLHKKQPNDADRLRKYLAKFGLSWSDLTD